MMVPTLNSFHLSQNHPNALLIVYPNAGHGSQFVYPGLFFQHLRNNANGAWVARVDAKPANLSAVDGPTGLEPETDCPGRGLFAASRRPPNSEDYLWTQDNYSPLTSIVARELGSGRRVPSSVMLPSLVEERIENMTNKNAGFLNESMNSEKSGTTRDLALMASAPQGARADARTGITSFIRGSSNRVITSGGLEWEGVFLEAHNTYPAERNDSIVADHLIALFTGHVSRGETAVSQGRFVPYSYYAGAIHLLPAGPIPACRAFTPSKMIVCALDPAFVREVGGEVDATVTEIRRTMDLRDDSLRGLMTLLALEAEAGGLSGKLYAEHLAHALALRFLWLSGEAHIPGHSHSGKMPNRVFSAFLTE